jgi:release factor glutamine methyltransferase
MGATPAPRTGTTSADPRSAIDATREVATLRSPRGYLPSKRSARLLDRAVHFLSYKFILSRRRTQIVRAAGMRLAVPPTVFHPRYFLTSEFFAAFVSRLDLPGKHVVDIGTGTGILALAAARSGAASVLAIDINPRAAHAAAENARASGLDMQVKSVCCDLLSSVKSGAHFDVILSNPPFFAGEPRDLADRAWHAGPGYRDIALLFDQARAHLAPGGSMYVVLSSHADLGLFDLMITRAGLEARLAAQRSIVIETMKIYELRPRRSDKDQNDTFLCSP